MRKISYNRQSGLNRSVVGLPMTLHNIPTAYAMSGLVLVAAYSKDPTKL